MSACTCRPRELPKTDCPYHGLYGDIVYAPMNRHAREVPHESAWAGMRRETAAETQQRLYHEARRPRLRFPVRTLPFREAMSQR